ncbi:MAG TPA: enoyl-CoA hydratase-related protein [Acidimicrobiia bacterium]|nr:enoyl-CoA hydratase-related protein [Acidimicrobiia bacterium]
MVTLTINRPPTNALTFPVIAEIYELLLAVAADRNVHVLVLTGAGGPGCGFAPGIDVRTVVAADGEVVLTDVAPVDPVTFRVPRLLHEMPQVTVAAINGSVAGAGLGWACACDVRVAAASARFCTAFLDRGVAGDMGGTWSLPRLVGAGRARDLYFFPDRFGAVEAERIGLVTRVFADEEFEVGLQELVDRLAAASPAALRMMKEHFVAAEQAALADVVDLEALRVLRAVTTPDAREGFRAFFENRTPVGSNGARR